MTHSSDSTVTNGEMPPHSSGARPSRIGFVVVLAAVLAATAALVAIEGTDSPACQHATPLRLVAAPAIAPALQEVVERDVDPSCVAVTVDARSAADVVAELASWPPGEAADGEPGPPALWVPDSLLWPKRARQQGSGGGPARIEEHPPIAMSPLVAVASRAGAARLGWPDAHPGWQELINGAVPATIGDPVATTEGLATLLVVRRLLGNPDGTPKPELVTALRRVAGGAVPTIEEAFDRLAAAPGQELAFAATEQAVAASNRAAGAANAVAIYPSDGTVALEYPVVRLTWPDEPAELDAAAETVDAALHTPQAVRVLQAAGFRDPGGAIGGRPDASAGIAEASPPLIAAPTLDQVTTVLRTWGAVTLPARLLVLVDVSSSMGAPAGNGQSLVELVRDATRTAVQQYPDATDVGLWAFSTRVAAQAGWAELVPIGRLDDQTTGGTGRRQVLATALDSLPGRVAGTTGLADTVLAAVHAQRSRYDAARNNAVVLVTDGRAGDRGGLSDRELLRRLRAEAEADPDRPVPLIAIGLGPDADFPTLQSIAAATGGRAYLAGTQADILGVFLDALVARRCHLTC
jgi:Ca-activated chloride channel family protein